MNGTVIGRLARRKGFTLVELLLAMLIGSIVVLGISTAYRQAYFLWSSVESTRPIYHSARLVSETLRQELACLYLPPKPDANDNDDSSGSEPAFKPIIVGETELVFFTQTPCWRAGLPSARMAKVRYNFTKDENTGESVLQRLEQPYAGEKPIGKEVSDIVVRGLSDFVVSASRGEGGENGGRGEDDNSETPPKAIKIILAWPETKDARETSFQATILIPCEGSLEGPSTGNEPNSAP
ncbi:MAG: PilW family protein [Planctomycetota bacterium]|jgi:prepilin-type N-terminal cleavage/methylation domain-containing protein